MVFWLSCFLLISLLVFSFLGPALLLTKHLHGSSLERLTVGIALSGIILYLLTFAIYAFNLPQVFFWVLIAAGPVAFLVSFGDFRNLLTDKSIRVPQRAFLFLTFWVALHLLIVRNFSGGDWGGDWVEHYQRAWFFQVRAPLDVRFLGMYWLPARPPLMNLLTGSFLSVFEPSFALYQITSAAMGLLVCLPLFLFTQQSHDGFERFAVPLVFLLALNPMFLQNAIYPWTRHLANFYILSGLYFYWRGVCEDNGAKIGLSLLFLASAMLTHYSAGPYAVCVLGHLSLRLGIARILREKFLLSFGLGSILLLATWFGWSLAHYGLAITAGSNTTVLGAQDQSWVDFASKFLYNLWSTLIPHWFRDVAGYVDLKLFNQALFWGSVRDSVFLVVQTNLIAALGLTGGILLLSHVCREIYRGYFHDSTWRFWAGMSVGTILLSVAVNDQLAPFGVAHVCLQPLVLLGLVRSCILTWQWGNIFRILLGVGTLVGYGLGILLQVGLEGLSFANNEALFSRSSLVTRDNWQLKGFFNLVFIGDIVGKYQKVFLALEILTTFLLCLGFALWWSRSNAHQKPATAIARGRLKARTS